MLCVIHHFPFHSGAVDPGLGAVWVSLQELGESRHGIWQTAGGREERRGRVESEREGKGRGVEGEGWGEESEWGGEESGRGGVGRGE